MMHIEISLAWRKTIHRMGPRYRLSLLVIGTPRQRRFWIRRLALALR